MIDDRLLVLLNLFTLGLAVGTLGATWWLHRQGRLDQRGDIPSFLVRRKKPPVSIPDEVNEPFCPACGARKIMFRQQRGFDGQTGSPNYVEILACPDWRADQNEPSWGYYSCSVSYEVEAIPVIVHDHPEGDVSADCKRCIIDMEKAGIISHDDAAIRLEKTA